MPQYDEPRDTIPAPSDFCDCALCAEDPPPLCDELCDCPVCHPPRPLAFRVTDEADD